MSLTEKEKYDIEIRDLVDEQKEEIRHLNKLLKNLSIRNKQLYSELQNHGWRKSKGLKGVLE